MAGNGVQATAGGGGLAAVWDEVRASFGLPAGVAMLIALVLGFGLPGIDDALDIEIPTFSFATEDAARGLLETIATSTVAVAGLAFSVTVVAFTLTSSQLSPRVLRSFRSDRMSQAVLALLLGTFIYCLAVLVRLGERAEGVPNLSITVALVLAFASFGMFALFVAHIATMLQPSSVIATILDEAKEELEHRFPSGIGVAAEGDGARESAASGMRRDSPLPVRAEGEGYLRLIQGERTIATAREAGALARQRRPVGSYVIPGETIAEVWVEGRGPDGEDALADELRACFVLGKQRSLRQDLTFPIRQLADIALKGLSPGINDPTTAQNAMEAMTAVIVRFASSRRPPELRADEDGAPRFLALVPALDDLVRLGFEQVRVAAAPHPVVGERLIELLDRIAEAARAGGLEHGEVARQAALLREGVQGQVPTAHDAASVRQA